MFEGALNDFSKNKWLAVKGARALEAPTPATASSGSVDLGGGALSFQGSSSVLRTLDSASMRSFVP